MLWKKKKKYDTLTMADMNNRTRGLILDSQIQNAHEISYLLGCSKISDELAEMEEEQSDARVSKINELVPLLFAYSKLMAEGTTTFQRSSLPEELAELSDEIWLQSKNMMEEFAFSVLVGSLSQLVDMKLVLLPKGKK